MKTNLISVAIAAGLFMIASFFFVPDNEAIAQEALFTTKDGTPLSNVVERVYLSGSVRIRPEYHSDETDFNNDADDSYDFVTNRFRLGLGVDFKHSTGVFLEMQNNSIWGDEEVEGANQDVLGDDDVKIYQGYIEARNVMDSPVSVKFGRQELVYGTELLLGDADFGTGISHDALKLNISGDTVSIDLWWSKEREDQLLSQVPAVLDANAEDADLLGVYAMLKPREGVGVDAYWLFLDNDTNEDERHTVGVRGYVSASEMLALNGELAYQFGDTGIVEQDINAYALEASATVRIADSPLKPRFTAGYAYASGDDDPDEDETFNPLFQDNHPRLGYSDLVVLSNLQALSFTGMLTPDEKFDAGAGVYFFWVAEKGDPVQPANFVGGPGVPNDDYLGTEFDIFVNFRLTEHIDGQFAWAHLFPGDYLEDRFGDDDGSDRLYLNMVASF